MVIARWDGYGYSSGREESDDWLYTLVNYYDDVTSWISETTLARPAFCGNCGGVRMQTDDYLCTKCRSEG